VDGCIDEQFGSYTDKQGCRGHPAHQVIKVVIMGHQLMATVGAMDVVRGKRRHGAKLVVALQAVRNEWPQLLNFAVHLRTGFARTQTTIVTCAVREQRLPRGTEGSFQGLIISRSNNKVDTPRQECPPIAIVVP
jgi:hypothetical protein